MAQASFLYFAYGSNMLTRRLCAPNRAPSARRVAVGRLRGYRLRFDKIGSLDHTGKCDAEWTRCAADAVQGVVFRVAEEDGPRLDQVEGLGKGYDHRRVQVETDEGELECLTYVGTARDPGLKPLCWYKALVVAGAIEHGLAPAYIEALHRVEAVPDSDEARRVAHEALLR